MPDTAAEEALAELARRRWRVALSLTLTMLAIYLGFILLIAFDKPLMGQMVAAGLSLGMLFGALVILAAWALTGIYIWWANTHYDPRIGELKGN